MEKNSELLPYALAFYFAGCNRSTSDLDSLEVATAKWESKIVKCRSRMLTATRIPSSELEDVGDYTHLFVNNVNIFRSSKMLLRVHWNNYSILTLNLLILKSATIEKQ